MVIGLSNRRVLLLWAIIPALSAAWTVSTSRSFQQSSRLSHTQLQGTSTHGEKACFLPLKQNGQDDYAPRIVQIAGSYPGVTKEEFMAVSSEPAPDLGQWTYDFSDPSGSQVGTVALQGSEQLQYVEEPVVIIAEHTSFGIQLPKAIKDPVDLVVLVDRAQTGFAERKFVVVNLPSEGLKIAAYPTKQDLPESAEILGRVIMVQIPWLPGMAPTKTGFAEADEYFTA